MSYEFQACSDFVFMLHTFMHDRSNDLPLNVVVLIALQSSHSSELLSAKYSIRFLLSKGSCVIVCAVLKSSNPDVNFSWDVEEQRFLWCSVFFVVSM